MTYCPKPKDCLLKSSFKSKQADLKLYHKERTRTVKLRFVGLVSANTRMFFIHFFLVLSK